MPRPGKALLERTGRVISEFGRDSPILYYDSGFEFRCANQRFPESVSRAGLRENRMRSEIPSGYPTSEARWLAEPLTFSLFIK